MAKTEGAAYPLQQHSCSHCALNWRVVVGAGMEVVVGPGSFKLARPATGPFLIAPTDGPGARDWDGWAGGSGTWGEATSLSERRACTLTTQAASRLLQYTYCSAYEQAGIPHLRRAEQGTDRCCVGPCSDRCLWAACSLCVLVTAYFVQLG